MVTLPREAVYRMYARATLLTMLLANKNEALFPFASYKYVAVGARGADAAASLFRLVPH